jgi:hypothetical protein
MADNLGEIDLDDLIDEDPPPTTRRAPGSSTLVIEDKMAALFTSAEWTLVATVRDSKGDKELVRSSTITQAHTQPFIKRWARQVIRANKVQLRRLGVNVETVYLGWGGLLEDLDD